jgi:hypothetical protein
MDAKSFDWEGIYGRSTLDLDYGATRTPGQDSNHEDILNDLGVPNFAAPYFWQSKDKSIDTCVPVSPFSQEFVDLHECRYLEKESYQGRTSCSQEPDQEEVQKWSSL